MTENFNNFVGGLSCLNNTSRKKRPEVLRDSRFLTAKQMTHRVKRRVWSIHTEPKGVGVEPLSRGENPTNILNILCHSCFFSDPICRKYTVDYLKTLSKK